MRVTRQLIGVGFDSDGKEHQWFEDGATTTGVATVAWNA